MQVPLVLRAGLEQIRQCVARDIRERTAADLLNHGVVEPARKFVKHDDRRFIVEEILPIGFVGCPWPVCPEATECLCLAELGSNLAPEIVRRVAAACYRHNAGDTFEFVSEAGRCEDALSQSR